MTQIPDPPDLPVLRTQADLADLWLAVLEPAGHLEPALWLLLVEPDGRPTPALLRIEEVPLGARPGPASLAGFATLLAELARSTERAARVALLLERPGPSVLTARDRAWASSLYAACRSASVPAEVIHLAGDEGVLPVPLDELSDTA
ncbi:hypothetical protein [Nocardioides pantholopis]|uniref:hypothetical protein n=1 Tax=Nocardioides pantholopis TaxID=2483798 RepID=UPI0013DDBB52|nr:hypothetical protein [Nocardioides pantholopis]